MPTRAQTRESAFLLWVSWLPCPVLCVIGQMVVLETNWGVILCHQNGEDSKHTKSPGSEKANNKDTTSGSQRLLEGNCGRDREGGGLRWYKETLSDVEKCQPQVDRSRWSVTWTRWKRHPNATSVVFWRIWSGPQTFFYSTFHSSPLKKVAFFNMIHEVLEQAPHFYFNHLFRKLIRKLIRLYVRLVACRRPVISHPRLCFPHPKFTVIYNHVYVKILLFPMILPVCGYPGPLCPLYHKTSSLL